ncbi:MAG: isocitrate lyase/PEP mutase family protein [Chloroflexi bacterium]|nr:isocitrate lyase/PEP mutase family protein [Chloroflexota bacterium]
MKKTALLRKYLSEDQIVEAPGAYDGVSARVIEQAGFKAVFVGGFGLSASLLGKPDVGLLTMSEVVNQTRNIANLVNIPVLADAEDGYGSLTNIQRTVREMERAGIAGIFLEDQQHPVRCGALGKYKKIVPRDEMVIKIRAALEAREDPDFIIAARTDSDIVSLQEQIDRCNAYAKAGADLVMPLTAKREEFGALVRGIRAPLWLLLGCHTDVTVNELRQTGARGLVTYAVEALFAAQKAVADVMQEIKEKGTVKETLGRLGAPDYRGFFKFMNLREVIDYEEKYYAEQPQSKS